MASVAKRGGRTEPWDKRKIETAVRKCLINNVGAREFEAAGLSRDVADAVERIVRKGPDPVGVEDVQRLVIQQLWAQNHFEAAEQYTLHRERRKKERLEHPVPAEEQERIERDAAHFPSPLQYYQFLSKFSRWQKAVARRETWRETCDRALGWLFSDPRAGALSAEEKSTLDRSLFGLGATCSMRVLQMAGPALDRCNVGAYNCAYLPISDLFSFSELLYVLMQGTGVGFSVETDYVERLPRVRKQKGAAPDRMTIADSTEGWCDALKQGLEAWFVGADVAFDYSQIRPEGAPLQTKGGTASGPKPLRDLLDFARKLVLSRQGGRLDDLDAHDLCCYIGTIVQVGGVRRASCISLSDLDSARMRGAKSGNWFPAHRHRTMANNSAVYAGRPSDEEFMEEWLSLCKSKSGERGIFNRDDVVRMRPARRAKAQFGVNPCAEIVLRPYEFCNLSISVAREGDTPATLRDKVVAATYFGVLQSLRTNFNYVRPDWKKNCDEERLLGVDITGHADCPLLRYGAPGRAELLKSLKNEVARTRSELAKRFGINESAADTCVKPSGDSAAFFDCASGISPRFSDFQTRWVREKETSAMAKFLVDEGVEHHPAPEKEGVLVFAFPKENPRGSTKRKDLTAAQQFMNWLEWKRCWAEHSVSASIYVGDDEWVELGHLVLKHFDEISGLAFFPRDNGNYRFAPNEEITREEFEAALAKFPKINWAKLRRYESGETQPNMEFACHGDKCEL
jgi:ribonucleoside-triphosphate reductase